MLDEVERGKDHIESKLEDAITDKDVSPSTKSVIHEVYGFVRSDPDQVQDNPAELARVNKSWAAAGAGRPPPAAPADQLWSRPAGPAGESAAGLSTLEQQGALAGIGGQRSSALEFHPRLGRAIELDQQVAAHGRQQVVVRQRGLVDAGCRPGASPAAGPNAIDTATARFSSTTGEGVSCASVAYSAAMRGQSVASAVSARAWQAAIAACSAYGPSAPPSFSARSSASEAATDQQAIPVRAVLFQQQHRLAAGPTARACARPGSPSARPARAPPVRAASARPARGRGAAPPRTSAGRIQSSPAVAE